MDEKYNVLANFENINRAHIFKNVTLSIKQTVDIDDFDNIPTKVVTKPKKKAVKPKSKEVQITEQPEIGELEIQPRRTRSNSKRNSIEISTEKSVSSKNNKIQKDKSDELGAEIRVVAARKNGAKSRGRRKNQSAVTARPIEDCIEIEDDEPGPTNSFIQSGPRLRRGRTRDVMYARRNYVAEHAARCPTVDVIDLVTSPLPLIQGVINVNANSDDDSNRDAETIHSKQSDSLDTSFDEDNPEINVKINWQGEIETFRVRKHQKFQHVFDVLSNRENVSIDRIFLNLNKCIIKPNDTPASIDYKIFDFIDGRAMPNSQFNKAGNVMKKKRDPNLIKLKVLSDKWKKPICFELYKTDNFKQLVIKCAEELNEPYENFKLCFDGETLKNDQTPIDLELEGGEVIEIHMKT